MKTTERIKHKIKALLSKTVDNGATKEEMESALQKANQLMRDFFISENDLKDENIIEKCVSETFKLTPSGYNMKMFYPTLAKLFECEFYYTSNTIVFFGHKQDVALCGYFYKLITRTCLLEKDKYKKNDQYMYRARYINGRTLASNFIRGFLHEVCVKMEQMYIDRQSSIPQQYGLMVIAKKQKVDKEFEALGLNIKLEKPSPINNHVTGAFKDGSKAGENFHLTQGIDGSETENTNLIDQAK